MAARKSPKKSQGKQPLRGVAADPSLRGRGPAKGAPKAGRPPDEFKAMLAGLASWDATLHSIATILRDPDHPAFQKALDYVTDRGYDKLAESVTVGGSLAVEVIRRVVQPVPVETPE
jgi:hypothetical protein